MSDVSGAEALDDGSPPIPPETDESGASEIESRARQLGWRPPEEFNDDMKNPPETFLSAEEYVRKAEDSLPIMRERSRYMGEKMDDLEAQLAKATGAIESSGKQVEELTTLVDDLHKQNLEVGKRAYEKAKRDLQSKMDRAVEEGETEVYHEAKQELRDLESERPPEPVAKPEQEPVQQPTSQPDPASAPSTELSPVAKSWIDGNQDIMQDVMLNPIAVGMHNANMIPKTHGGAGMTEQQSLDAVRKEIRKRFPEKFENTRRNDPPPVSGSSPPPPRKKTKGFDDLPADAKATYNRLKRHFEAKNRTYTPEEYAKQYFIENEGAA